MADKNANSVDKIRDLIFGSQMKDFEIKFNELNDTLKVLEEKIDNLSSSTYKDKTKLKELIDTTDKSLQEQLAHQKDKFVTKLKVLKENVEDENKKMADTMAQMQSDIHATIEKNISSLSDDKLSRDAMAKMLLDVAMKIQGKKTEK